MAAIGKPGTTSTVAGEPHDTTGNSRYLGSTAALVERCGGLNRKQRRAGAALKRKAVKRA